MARIRNRLTGTEELFGTVKEADAALEKWLQNWQERGCAVLKTADGSYSVSEPDGRAIGIFDIE